MADEIRGIICLHKQSAYANAKIGEFVRTNDFDGVHVYQGKSFSMEEFNAISDKVIDSAILRELKPHVRLIKVAPESAKKAAKKAAKKKEDK